MNEPKKRGRPSKSEIAARNAQVEGGDVQVPVINGDTTRELEDVIDATPFEGKVVYKQAQAYALRVWAGQSESLSRHERLGRVADALKAQGLSMDGVVL